MAPRRKEQLAYSELMAAMLDEDKRRQKAAKILAVAAARPRPRRPVRAAGRRRRLLGRLHRRRARAGRRHHAPASTSTSPGWRGPVSASASGSTSDCARGEALPFDDGSVDVVVLNHIYEHVVDPEAVVADIHRVLAPAGSLYLGIGHRLGRSSSRTTAAVPVVAAPRRAADRYMRLTGTGDHYYERYSPARRAAPAVRARSTSGTTPCRCSPTRPAFTGSDGPGLRSRASPRRCCRRCCRWSRPTSGWGSGRRARRAGLPSPCRHRAATSRPRPAAHRSRSVRRPAGAPGRHLSARVPRRLRGGASACGPGRQAAPGSGVAEVRGTS